MDENHTREVIRAGMRELLQEAWLAALRHGAAKDLLRSAFAAGLRGDASPDGSAGCSSDSAP